MAHRRSPRASSRAASRFSATRRSRRVLCRHFGSFYSEQVHYLVDLYSKFTAPRKKTLGCTPQQPAAPTRTRSGGDQGSQHARQQHGGPRARCRQLPDRVLLDSCTPEYHLRPVLQCIQEHIEPMRHDLKWGFDIPYMITGMRNEHPRAAMKFNAGENRGDLVKFFDEVVESE